jgi:hypothetical protein
MSKVLGKEMGGNSHKLGINKNFLGHKKHELSTKKCIEMNVVSSTVYMEKRRGPRRQASGLGFLNLRDLAVGEDPAKKTGE